MTTRTTDGDGGGTTFWQAGGGAQLQLVERGLWLRTEATASRNADLLSRLLQPRESLSIGLNGQLAPRTTVGVDLYLDRGLQTQADGSAWTTRSMVRVTQSLTTGSPFATPSSASGPFRTVPLRALATVRGTVYADWNGNGLRDAGEDAVARVPLRIEASGGVESGANGEFVFKNVPDGLHDVAIDTRSLPVDFDPPRIPRVQLSLSGRDTREVSFGIVPLGQIRGRVVRDLNGNGAADPGEPTMDEAVVVLDDGIRSERSKRGRFAFEAVPAGEHAVTLLSDSLPEASIITGATTKEATLGRNRMAVELEFLVSIVKRAEVRRVFADSAAASPRGAAPPRSAAAATRPAVERAPEPARAPGPRRTSRGGEGRFVLQVAAFDDPLRARRLVAELAAGGFDAYLGEPPLDNPDAPYRVRVGAYATRAEAEVAAAAVTRAVGQKPWITRE
jgi:cell division septation protein DedD